MEYGAEKYQRGNYHGQPPVPPELRYLGYIDAALRHLSKVALATNQAIGTGGDVPLACAVQDPESKLPHIDHALASLLLAIECGVVDKILVPDPGKTWRR